MLTYEFIKEVVVCTAFIFIIIAGVGGWTYWICELVSFIRRKVKNRRADKQADKE